MIICKQVISKDDCAKVLDALENWEEGQSALGSEHKQNLEIKNHPLAQSIAEAIAKHPLIRKYSYIKQMTLPRFNKYVNSGKYADHVDFFRQEGIRTDWSMTLFLNEDYEGGELVIEGEEVKLAAGDMVLYPSGQIHRVNPVTKGERIAAIAWAESFIRSQEDRNILNKLVDVLSEKNDVRLSYVYDNLLRKWAS